MESQLENKKILWVEDEALVELQYLYAPVVVAGFDLHLATNASQAVALLRLQRFSALVVDIRIPPGDDPLWQRKYYRHNADPAAARLGLHLLESLLLPHRVLELPGPEDFSWLSGTQCAAFSVDVENKGNEELKKRGVIFEVKGPHLPADFLLGLIQRILLGQSKAKSNV